jgi:hypothetical protein
VASRAELEAAAAAGVISAEQAAKLGAFLGQAGAPAAKDAPLSGEEDFRFIRNFHDLFLAIGILLFAIGMAVGIASLVAAGAVTIEHGAITSGVLCVAAAGVMWVLSEVFARRRRLFLPAIATVIAFTWYLVFAVAALYSGAVAVIGGEADFGPRTDMPPTVKLGILLTVAMFAAAPALFYARFRLPFSLGMVGGGIALLALAALLVFAYEQRDLLLPIACLGLGLALFAAAVAFDARDPSRVSRLSDNGFWLHFAAAPFILTGAFGLLNQAFIGAEAGMLGTGGLIMLSSQGGEGVVAMAAATLGVVVLLGLVSLLINRRVLIVSSLLTTGVAIGALLNAAGMGASAIAAATLLSLGGFVLVLGAGWHSARRGLLGWVKPDGVWARIFPPAGPE